MRIGLATDQVCELCVDGLQRLQVLGDEERGQLIAAKGSRPSTPGLGGDASKSGSEMGPGTDLDRQAAM
jgi:hypothetical protein